MNNSQNQVIQSYKEFWTRFLDINGRSTRPNFWHPFWINFVISSLLGIVSAGLLSSVFAIAIIIPSFTVMARRLHDTNRTMVLAIVSHISGFIAMVATIVFIVGVLAVASSGSGGMIGATLLAGAFGAVVAGVIALYTLYVLVITGNRELNNYGSGGSCEIDPQAHTH
ncbi:MAG: DUF805 domain-containing protein [Staphylococcus equorum]|uniref:DUF805 domain-containing protein n=1 Tax=Staphylococcus TaxID=1279 RepID=UPI00085339B4|nr:DUF805 domain-containing protein [Staphylococcus equorum]MDG0822777.1 DUF805 domain-containing protein [Staphylococcus equorum]MDG0837043.1 DUF805 domain-containing protein [Staphylococcus equorum]MDK9871634.1 DUF805 domain-containing protein [Staphylococcus equorum]MDK9877795.1 DUF805 domain-containing protein [Staphylococcus equorum]MDN5809656.1 DUF805 domain-containing protein [Staphylococcus equorum]